ncbi:MAG: class I SAM-dependent methyltransferase [Streptosporangiales bacterium]|nr:class I SAM-dependent methyltransferase [Streptosporangiales bacterium]
MHALTFSFLAARYEEHADALRGVRKEQQELHDDGWQCGQAQLDDIEAEITYLLLRDYRPETLVEIGSLYGWSTSWILRALRDNGHGSLYTYDVVDHVTRTMPPELSADRWVFREGDVRQNLAHLPADIDYLFIDAAHSARFALWYIDHLFPRLRTGTPTSVHDVFHRRRPLPWTEGAVVLGWLRERDIPYFTAAKSHEPDVHDRLMRLRERLGLADPIHSGQHNPMIFFTYARAGDPMPRR